MSPAAKKPRKRWRSWSDFLRDPSKFQKLGGRIPRGVLMVGAPGTGKTLLAARSRASEGAVLLHLGSDFVEMFVGVGAARVRDMFEQAKKHAPCIVFIDEHRRVGRQRGAGLGGGNDEREQTLNQLLVEMDGFEPPGVIVIAATNRPDVLTRLLRPAASTARSWCRCPIFAAARNPQGHMRKVPLAPESNRHHCSRHAWISAARRTSRFIDQFARSAPENPGVPRAMMSG